MGWRIVFSVSATGSVPRSREFLESLVDAVREPLVVLDQDLRVVSVSRAFYEVFRVKPKETIGQLIYDLGDRQWDIPKLRELLETVLPQNTSFRDFEVVHTFSGIGRRTMLLNARRIRRGFGKKQIILLAIEDITTRKVVETDLEKARQELVVLKIAEDDAREFAQSIIDTIREPLVALDQDLAIVAVSQAFYNVFHVTPDQTVGHTIYELGNGQWDIPRLRELLDTLLLQATSFNDYEVTLDFSSIGLRTMLLNARQVKRSLGKERIILLAIEDVTDRTRMEAEREKNQRVESLGVLAGGIAHDFNNLMAGLLANTELAILHLDAGQTTEAFERLKKTPSIFVRGRALTQRLLTFSKGVTPNRATCSLGPHFSDWVDFALMGSDITATLDIDPNLWFCDCDLGQIGQVMNNLLINARQASLEGGVVTVQATNFLRRGPYLSVKITNGGAPIPAEYLSRIFDPFFTTKAEGSGLGLATSYSIVRQHGGWIDVLSKQGEGTQVSLFLPASPSMRLPVKVDEAVKTFQGSGIALVMDDNADVLEAACVLMKRVGYEVYRASSGEKLLEIYLQILREGREVNAFLLDLQIPGGLGGLATAQKLRELGALGSIVIMSGYFESVPGIVIAEADGIWRLAKPFTSAELWQILASSASHQAAP